MMVCNFFSIFFPPPNSFDFSFFKPNSCSFLPDNERNRVTMMTQTTTKKKPGFFAASHKKKKEKNIDNNLSMLDLSYCGSYAQFVID